MNAMISGYILQAFTLAAVVIVMAIILIQGFRSRKQISVLLLLILGVTVVLFLLLVGEDYAKLYGNMVGATICTYFGYIIRPFLLYGFMLLARKKYGKTGQLLVIPLFVNLLIYSSCLFFNFEPLGHLTFYYVPAETGVELVHMRGPLNFTSHILSAVYLCILLYFSVKKLRGKHRNDALSILICAIFIVAAVIIEMTGVCMGVLNIGIAISVVFYYLFLLKEENRRDALTDLFDRKTFYLDLDRFAKDVRGVIQVDMNGLKYINDTQGHQAGDDALKTIGATLESVCAKDMYVYRMGGDEFTVLVLNDKSDLKAVSSQIKANIEEKGLSTSVGFAYRESPSSEIEQMLRVADEAMYADKAQFYASHPNANRRSPR